MQRVSDRDKIASHRHFCLDIALATAGCRDTADSEAGQYRQQYAGAQRDCQAICTGN
jgi:hypothetical protein